MTDATDRSSTAPTATHWGSFLVRTDGDRIVGVDGHPTDPDPSPIGQALLDSTEARVTKPAVRRSWLTNGPGPADGRRGREPFVEVEWDEALDLVADEVRRVVETHGNDAIYGGSYGWGASGRFHTPAPQLQRFLRQYGGHVDRVGTYSGAAAEAIVPHVLGLGYFAAVGKMTSWSVIAEHTELFVSFGSLRLTNAQVTFGGAGPHHTEEWLDKCGHLDFVNIGPLADDQGDRQNVRWQPIRPGTDVALMAALIHTLDAEGLADQAFLDRYCHGWDRLRAYLIGTTDGQPKDADWAAAITGIAAPVIQALARKMAANRTLVSVGLSIQRADHGEQTYWMAVALAAALGQIGLPGGGIAMGFGASGEAGSGQTRKRIPGCKVPIQPPGMPIIPVSRIADALESPGRPLPFNGTAEPLPDLRLVYWAGGNPFHHHQDLNRLVRAWQRPDTVIVHEPFWNPMARHADIVLPATTPVERNDLGSAETVLIAMTAAIPPHGQARDDYAILAGVAERL
ncbi:MAG: molybdopterin-dependent oxidoreductase, partial [Actinomycetota bacterium]